MEEVACEYRRRLDPQEVGPGRTRPPRRKAGAVTPQDRPYARGCEVQSHRGQLIAGSPKAPCRAPLGEARHPLDRARGYCRPARATPPVRPSAPDQVPMPAKQSFGLHQRSTSANLRHQPAQPGEDHSVGGPQYRTGHLAAQDRDLVSEHHDLNGRFVLFGAAEPEQLEHPNEGRVEIGKCHGSPSLLVNPDKVQTEGVDGFLGTHTAQE